MGVGDKFSCYKCGGSYTKDEFEVDEDLCSYCLFPEAITGKPAQISYSEGVPKNVTNHRKMLDELDYIPEKQSEQAKKAYKKYKNRTDQSRS